MHSVQSTIFLCVCLVLVIIVCARFVSARRANSVEPSHSPVTDNADAVLPLDFHSWVYVHHSAAAHTAQQDRRVADSFPNIYVAPNGYVDYLRSGVFPDGTIAFRQLVLGSFPSASNIAGRKCRICYAPNREDTADVRIKDTARFGETDGWGYFQFDLSQANNPN